MQEMIDFSAWPLWVHVAAFFVGAGAVGWAGTRLAALGDHLADRTGLGEAITGTIFLGLVTALPGLAVSITAALAGRPALAISNALGGIAVQTTFLAIADLAHVRANLEHAAASVANMVQTAMLIALLALVLLGLTGPDVTVAHVHPMTPALFMAAGFGFWLVYQSSKEPMWTPERTAETVEALPRRPAAARA